MVQGTTPKLEPIGRTVLRTIRDAMKDKGLGDDRRVRATFVSRFLVRLDQLVEKGTVERIGSGNGVRWKLSAELDRGLL
jgi:hypothetical protein